MIYILDWSISVDERPDGELVKALTCENPDITTVGQLEKLSQEDIVIHLFLDRTATTDIPYIQSPYKQLFVWSSQAGLTMEKSDIISMYLGIHKEMSVNEIAQHILHNIALLEESSEPGTEIHSGINIR